QRGGESGLGFPEAGIRLAQAAAFAIELGIPQGLPRADHVFRRQGFGASGPRLLQGGEGGLPVPLQVLPEASPFLGSRARRVRQRLDALVSGPGPFETERVLRLEIAARRLRALAGLLEGLGRLLARSGGEGRGERALR